MSEQNRVTDPKEIGVIAQSKVSGTPSGNDVPHGDQSPERDEGSVRRPLIRATLRQPDGNTAPTRPAPVFTMHEQDQRGQGEGRGGNRSARFGRDGNKSINKKASQDRFGQRNSNGSRSTGSGKKRSSRQGGGAKRSSSRRSKGRSR